LVLKSDGTLQDTTVAYFESKGAETPAQMVRDTELSAQSVTVDPAQDVLATSTVEVAIALLPIGVSRNIIVKIGFTASIQ